VSWGRITKKDDKGNTILYLHVFDWPKDGKLLTPAFNNSLVSVSLLGSNEKIKAKSENGAYEIKLPDNAPNKIASVVRLEVKGDVASEKTAAKDKMKAGELD
jgi:alpha-L-fucosidase